MAYTCGLIDVLFMISHRCQKVIDKTIEQNLNIARQKINDASKVSGVSDVIIVGVTKNRTPDQVADLIMSGCSNIGENRVQEWEHKYPKVLRILNERGWDASFTSHLVGILQSNKVRRVLNDFTYIQSLDRIKLAIRINRIADEESLEPVPCLIQVKLGDEESKSGIPKQELMNSFEEFISFENVKIVGLMLIAPLWAIGEDARPYYKEMFELFNHFKAHNDSRFDMKYLSMGMSADFDVAVEEGANMVRIGRALFDGFDNL